MSLPRFLCFGVTRPRRVAPPRVCRLLHNAVLSISRSSLAIAPDAYICPPSGYPPRHRSRACHPRGSATPIPGTTSCSTVSTLRSSVMRRVVARGQLECVCPWQLAPSKPRPVRTAVFAGREGTPAWRFSFLWRHHRRCTPLHLPHI